ncbi:hypothetical protein [Stagnihabitans tardus]|uniref:Uncharacterized protein n=1 Tax=Stagnihabitans tardus TaxID=2699202 RepID=A0AAE4YCB3_9RHOB|nr:hypothetical protein [Stagnihabitans tardus]NBZ90087.1 hypothetical protein [Stagnihabitans tardus]
MTDLRRRLALRLLALAVFAGALIAAIAGIVYALLGAGSFDAESLTLGALALGLSGVLDWLGLTLWRKARKSSPPPGPDTFR